MYQAACGMLEPLLTGSRERPPLVGMGGSGTIFLSHCNLRCVFCQNFHISHIGHGE
ncbi:MAG: radical SAM protein, partial [Nitrospinota bacterium]|nr:radical SAM protein [Nitrospinota bacterium]